MPFAHLVPVHKPNSYIFQRFEVQHVALHALMRGKSYTFCESPISVDEIVKTEGLDGPK
jgi:hypothetical protein